MKKEIFVLYFQLKTFSELDDAIDFINGKPKPLALYYFGQNTSRTSKVLKGDHSSGMRWSTIA